MRFRMKRTTAYRRDGIVSPTDLLRAHRGGAARLVLAPAPITIEPIDVLADLDRAWSEWTAVTGQLPAA